MRSSVGKGTEMHRLKERRKRSQAAPLTILIITSAVVVIGLGLIAYVNSLIGMYQEQALSATLLSRLTAATMAYVEHYYNETAGLRYYLYAYTGIANIEGMQIRYYFLVIPANRTQANLIDVGINAVDPQTAQVGVEQDVNASTIYLYAGNGMYMTLAQLYPDLPQLQDLPWVLFGPGYTEPYLVEITSVWENELPPIYLVVLVKLSDSYYEVGRLFVPNS